MVVGGWVDEGLVGGRGLNADIRMEFVREQENQVLFLPTNGIIKGKPSEMLGAKPGGHVIPSGSSLYFACHEELGHKWSPSRCVLNSPNRADSFENVRDGDVGVKCISNNVRRNGYF